MHYLCHRIVELLKRKERNMAATVFNQAQLDIIEMMQWIKNPETLADLKKVIADFFANKAKKEMDAMWANGEMTQEKLESFKTLHERTSYSR